MHSRRVDFQPVIDDDLEDHPFTVSVEIPDPAHILRIPLSLHRKGGGRRAFYLFSVLFPGKLHGFFIQRLRRCPQGRLLARMQMDRPVSAEDPVVPLLAHLQTVVDGNIKINMFYVPIGVLHDASPVSSGIYRRTERIGVFPFEFLPVPALFILPFPAEGEAFHVFCCRDHLQLL